MNGEDVDAIHRIGNGAVIDLDYAIATLMRMRRVRAEHRAIILFKKSQRVKFTCKDTLKDGQTSEKIGFVQGHHENGQLEISTANGETFLVDSYSVEAT
jgi:hypothetical protein